MARPKNETPRKHLNVTIDSEVFAALDDAKWTQRKERSALVNDILREALCK